MDRNNFYVPDDKVNEALDYAKKLRKNHPSWSPEKITKKVGEKFKFKAKPQSK